MVDRYFVEDRIAEPRGHGTTVRLSGAEAHHLIHVMRAKPGGQVVLFDGSGAEFPARVEKIGRSEVDLAVLGRQSVDRELPVELTLGVALPKGDRQRWLVEKAVELGVGRIVPLRTERSVAQPEENALARLRRTVIEASKQCGRNHLMEMAPPQAWPDFVAAAKRCPHRLLAHPCRGDSASRPLADAGPTSPPEPVAVAVGPEGGLTTHEVALAIAAGWQTVDLGPRILRVETAAFLLVALVTRGR
ncbi:MAG: 16S rRNA (uracil(1498)-N(3))-methyltransferase [Pirellulales bacterium]|nr:16S rRNA (uracil(1498)-N(3))-methyltransferase [Pirellulales bacterium]